MVHDDTVFLASPSGNETTSLELQKNGSTGARTPWTQVPKGRIWCMFFNERGLYGHTKAAESWISLFESLTCGFLARLHSREMDMNELDLLP